MKQSKVVYRMSHNLFYFQAEEHSLHLQHHPGGVYLAHIHCPIPDGQKHLVLCGQPLFQVPLLLPCIQHLNHLSLPHRLKPESAALAFSCQQEENIHCGHSKSFLMWTSGALHTWGWQLCEEEGKNEVY